MGGLPLILTSQVHGYSTRSVIKISLSQTVALTLLRMGWVQRVQQIIALQLHTTGHFLYQLFVYRFQHIIKGSRFRRVS